MGTCNKSTCSERVCTDPPILGHLQQPPAAATSSNINHLQLFLQLAAATCSNIDHLQLFFTTCSGHMQQYQPLAATTCSDYLQRLIAAQKSLQKNHKNSNNNKGPTQKNFKTSRNEHVTLQES